MELSQLLLGVSLKSSYGYNPDVKINKIEFDSRKVSKSDLFIAIKGIKFDGHDFIDNAIDLGCSTVLLEKMPNKLREKVCYLLVENSAVAMSYVSSNYFGNPSSKIKLIGVTGTNGKTTIATLLYKLFNVLGFKVGLLSTIENKIGDNSIPSTHTTADSIQINKLLSQMIDDGCEYCFMEVSSHAVHQHRTSNLLFDLGVFTNLTHEHLDYHKTFKEYLKSKKLFFDNLSSDAFAIVNKDDKNGLQMVANSSAKKITYSLKKNANHMCKVIESRFDGMLLEIDSTQVWVNIIGEFNAYNLLAVYCTALHLGIEKENILRVISLLKPANGRFHAFRSSDGITAIVDYMHTPDAYENVLSTINKIRKKSQKLIIVFGCGGDRDKDKRPVMTSIATNMTDQVIITSDNPRSEKLENIIDDMISELNTSDKNNLIVINDRSHAIKTACKIANSGDIILLAGKGHEKYQEINGVKIPFDDIEEIVKSLKIDVNVI